MKNQAVPAQGDFFWSNGILYDNTSGKQVPVVDETIEASRFCELPPP